jgi:hypothetical protein
MKLLYWTGKISRRQYLQFTEGKGLPTSRFMIRTHQALGLISKRQADYLVTKKERENKFAEIATRKLEQKQYREWAKGKTDYEKVYRAGFEAKERREQQAEKVTEQKAAENQAKAATNKEQNTQPTPERRERHR